MNHFNALNVGRLDSVTGVGQSQGAKAPSLARFLSQRANEVLGNRQTSQTVERRAVEQESAPVLSQDSAPVNPQLARQMDQLQRLHTSISLPSGYQGINVVV
ncbi:MAG: hypothetical protein J0I12_03860 [Candidatus Eremiobacteraeota bacterium]|nr:hypothetical protein [Candidatus Eremiobacteraeota bacterium]